MKKIAGRKRHRDIIEGWYPFSDAEIHRYVSRGFWHNMTVTDCLDRNAERFPDKLAVTDGLTEVTWGELKEKANRLAIQLLRFGVEYGDFFLLQLPNVVEFFYMWFALNRIGAVPIMGLPRHRRMEVNHIITLHKPKGICVPVGESYDFVGMVEEIRRHPLNVKVLLVTKDKAPSGWHSIEKLLKEPVEKNEASDYLEQFKPDPNDICTEQLSGGTTGLPKGIPRTHNDYICGWEYLARVYGYTDDSVGLVPFPVAHNANMQNISGAVIYHGGTIVLSPSPKAEAHFQLVEKYKVTHTLLIPVQITYWMEAHQQLATKYDLSSLKMIASGGQKVRHELVRWCIETLGVGFGNTYGMSEGPQLATRWHSSKEVMISTIGGPIIRDPDCPVKLVDPDNQEVEKGQIGEMIIKGPLMFKGYYKNEEETRKAFDEQGFYHSGDLMSISKDGYFIVEGRKKDMIIRGGENIYPEYIEDSLRKHPGVANCVAIGMPDLRLGEKLCAIIQPMKMKKLTPDEVVDYLKDIGIAVFQLPERLEILEGWPLTPVGKIDKRRLRAYVVVKLFREGAISKDLGDEYLKRDGFNIDDVLSGKIEISFAGTPS
jgi:2,3-dihydroxybenzoate-AMP ligase